MLKKKKILIIILAAILIIGGFFCYKFYIYNKNATIGTAYLSWNQNTESDLAGYKIYYGTNPRTGDCPPGGYPDKIDIKNATNHAFDNLSNNQTYFFSVTSYNKSGAESCFSPEVKKTIKVSKINILKRFLKSLF